MDANYRCFSTSDAVRAGLPEHIVCAVDNHFRDGAMEVCVDRLGPMASNDEVTYVVTAINPGLYQRLCGLN